MIIFDKKYTVECIKRDQGALQKHLWAHKSGSLSIFTYQYTTFFQCMGKIFCAEFQRERYPYIERDDFFQYWKFKNSQIYKLISVFETPPNKLSSQTHKLPHFAGMAFAHQVYFTSHMRPPLMFNFIMIDYLLVYAL